MLAQTFVPTCSGILNSLTLPFTFSDNNPNNIGINITLYKGNDPTDVNSTSLLQIIGYKPRLNASTINIPLSVQISASTNYYFIVSNSQGGNLPSNLTYTNVPIILNPGGLWAWLNAAPGWVNYQYRFQYNKKIYGLDMDYSLSVGSSYVAVSRTINNNFTTCLGNVIKIHNQNNNCLFLTSDTNNVFKITSNNTGDILINTTNYGMASFTYAVGADSPKVYRSTVTVMPNDPPAITASQKVLTALTDNVTLTAEGSPNVALGFDGNTYLTIPYNRGFSSSNIFTYEGWIMCNNVSNGIQYIFSKGIDDLILGQYGIYINDGKIVFNSRYSTTNSNNFFSAVPISSNTWTHIAITNDGATIKFYFNGVEIGSAGYSNATIDNQQDIQIGHIGL
jgi:hypothetical protein